MATWTSLVLLSTAVVSTFSLPRPAGEYNIPDVGNGQRSQYYVLHSDGTHKYGYDTGEGAFESLKTHGSGDVDGKFGYTDPEGNQIRVEYESGPSGFVARGDHLPQVSPDHASAIAAALARSSTPFVDPLATNDLDPSYDFKFQSEDHSRNEISNSDGTVTGSYSYVDEFGETRRFNYRAGKGIGFVIEGDGIPQDTNSINVGAASSQRVSSNSASRFSGSSARPSLRRTSQNSAQSTSQRRTQQSSSSYQAPAKPSRRIAQHTQSRPARPSVRGGSGSQFSAGSISSQSIAPVSQSSQASRFGSHSTSGTSTSQISSVNRPFEEANIRSSLSPEGSYSFAYDTSTHSRAETGDNNNRVTGDFRFVAEDDGQQRQIQYEASSDTGFIAEGSHIPTGPIVPGAPFGQPTGRIVPVVEDPFIDPLAGIDSDRSYAFNFDSETYSRSESSDSDGNVVGTYTVVDDDGTIRTHRFRAGAGIGFETEEISVSSGPAPQKIKTSGTSSAQDTSIFRSGTAGISGSQTGTVRPSQSTHRDSFQRTGASSGSSSRFSSPSSSLSSSSHSHSAHSGSSSGSHRGAASHSTLFRSDDVSPSFKLHQYNAHTNPDKYGYVLNFN